MTKGISRNCCFGDVSELFLEKVGSELELVDDVVIISCSFIILNESATQYLPIFGFEQFLYSILDLVVLLHVPMLEETHFTVNERSPGLFVHLAVGSAIIKTVVKGCRDARKYVLYGCKPVAGKIRPNIVS